MKAAAWLQCVLCSQECRAGVKGKQEAGCTPGPAMTVLKYWLQLQNDTMQAKELRIPGMLGVQSAPMQPWLVSSSRCAASSAVVLDISVTP